MPWVKSCTRDKKELEMGQIWYRGAPPFGVIAAQWSRSDLIQTTINPKKDPYKTKLKFHNTNVCCSALPPFLVIEVIVVLKRNFSFIYWLNFDWLVRAWSRWGACGCLPSVIQPSYWWNITSPDTEPLSLTPAYTWLQYTCSSHQRLSSSHWVLFYMCGL
jgi:hypothetical protein